MKLASFIVLFLAMAFRLRADIILNGSFETGGFTDWTVDNNGGSSANLTVTQEGFEDGSYGAAFNFGDTPPKGILSQSFTTVSGQQYSLVFYYETFGGGTGQTLDVSVNGSGNLLTQTATSVVGSFTEFDYNFTADSTTATLQFADDAGNPTISTDGILDNVQVVTAVPEANTAWTGFGVLLLVVLSKRRLWHRSQPASIAPSVSP